MDFGPLAAGSFTFTASARNQYACMASSSHYRPNMQYDAIRYRLLDWKISIADESFETLVQDPITIEQIRLELLAEVSAFESEAARALLPQAIAKDGPSP